MTTTPVGSGQSVSGTDVTSGNTLDVQSGGSASTTTVENGGTLQVDPGGAETGAMIKAGGVETVTGTINSSNVVTSTGTSTGDDVFGTINVGGTVGGGLVSNVTIENGGAVNLILKTAQVNGATVKTGGLLTINGNAPANNVTLQGGMLELESPKADSTNSTAGQPSATGDLTFASGYQSRLQLDVNQTGTNGTTFSQTIDGFAAGDAVDLRSQLFSGATLAAVQNGTSSTVTVSGGASSGSETFTFSNTTAANFSLAADNAASPGTEIHYAVCYCSGTRIKSLRGAAVVDVAVEALAAGDLVVTSSGAHRPVRWVGHREVDCRRASDPASVLPVRVAAHAISPGRPSRDLWLSPGHALCLDVLGEVLVPVSALINGTTIARMEVETTTYWHVELDGHDILLAEDMPAESYLEMGNRGFFAEGDVVAFEPRPDAKAPTHADFCRPFHQSGALVEVMRERLAARAGGLGWHLEDQGLGGLHMLVDGVRVEPQVRGLSARFALPAAARDVWLVSRTSVPAHLGGYGPDQRELGVIVAALTIDNGFDAPLVLRADDPRLCDGFYPVETAGGTFARWTSGRARLPTALWDQLDGDVFVRVDLARPALPRWVKSAPASDSAVRVAAA